MQKKSFAVEDKELSATKSFAALFDAARKTSAYEAEARELEAISNKCRFGEWRFQAAHRTFADGMNDPATLDK